MDDLINSIRFSIKTENYYAALAVSLMLPDIAGKIDYPNMGVGERYRKWCLDNMSATYGNFFTPEDFYALRCKYLHEGHADIPSNDIDKIIDTIYFTVPGTNTVLRSKFGGKRTTQIDIFCMDIINAIELWKKAISGDFNKETALSKVALNLFPFYNHVDGKFNVFTLPKK
jgi:hypothetical protein